MTAALMDAAQADDAGGYDTGWFMGSIWDVEGRFLYALASVLKPETVLEVGVSAGCSTTHFLSAAAGYNGDVIGIDINAGAGFGIPPHLRQKWTFLAGDAADMIETRTMPTNALIFEDGAHTYDFTLDVLQRLVRLDPQVVVSHDFHHWVVGEDVQRAWDDVFGIGNYSSALMAPSDCGLSWYVRGVHAPINR
jgi:hypothetical protein